MNPAVEHDCLAGIGLPQRAAGGCTLLIFHGGILTRAGTRRKLDPEDGRT
jgi:hypothetical protein